MFASGSIAGSITTTTVTPQGGGLLSQLSNTDVSTHYGFAISAMAGGTSKHQTTVSLDNSSGEAAEGDDESEGSDEHLTINFEDTSTSENYVGFSFAIGNAPDDSTESSDGPNNPGSPDGPTTKSDDDETPMLGSDQNSPSMLMSGDFSAEAPDGKPLPDSPSPPDDGDDDSSDGSDSESPNAGRESAGDIVGEGVSGMQIAFDMSRSSTVEKDHTLSSKTRRGDSNLMGHSYKTTDLQDKEKTTSSNSVSIAFGGETKFEIRSSDSHSIDTSLNQTDWQTEPYFSFDENDLTTRHVHTDHYKGKTSSTFGMGFGAVDDPGLTNESTFDVSHTEISETHDIAEGEHSTVIITEIFRNSSNNTGDNEPSDPSSPDATAPIDRETNQYRNSSGDILYVIRDSVPSPGDGVEFSDGEDSRSTDDLLSEYTDRATRAERLRQQIAEEDDPGMREYYQDQLDTQEDILEDLRQEATDAGIETSTLTDLDDAAEDAADEDPIDLETSEEFNDEYDDSSAPGYSYYWNNPSAMDGDLQAYSNFSKGVVVGAGTAAVAITGLPLVVAGSSFILTSLGVSSAAAGTISTAGIYGGLIGMSVRPALTEARDTYQAVQNGDWNTVAYNGGAALGGAIVGGFIARAPNRTLMQGGGVRGVERASDALLDSVRSKGRTINFAEPGSDSLRFLDHPVFGGNASVSGERFTNILLRRDPRKIEVLEEFLHGTQFKTGRVGSTGQIPAAERHVKDFMIRHRKLLGIGDEDVSVLRQLLEGAQ